ncbi:phosphoglycerate mutase [Fictibacillus macauensis ZFHKF-1]|uniref:Phosphoglycerate mutase n=1 Tax=Fictibacillus macauensis ZFHKF-1 TaxID=1196324 RepID=I8UF13_9BACL|nr:histidine phosphatase family protein [Fictibacillus macauensis]EIT85408.1 phosphoglycerate mutase [Fictibacillus macauensis ZFHKF-1]
MTTIAIVRHGCTDWNIQKRLQGARDIPLNEQGRKQAEVLGKRLSENTWDAIYTSDLARAQETAMMIAEKLRVPVTLEPRIREVYFGRLEGTNEAERKERWGDAWRSLDLGQEPDALILKRAHAFLDDVAARYEGKNIIAVSHGAFINKILHAFLLKQQLEPQWLHNTAVSLLVYEQKRWHCSLYNCGAHLTDVVKI